MTDLQATISKASSIYRSQKDFHKSTITTNLDYQAHSPIYMKNYPSSSLDFQLSSSIAKPIKNQQLSSSETQYKPSQSLVIQNLKALHDNEIKALTEKIKCLQEDITYEKQLHERQYDNLKTFLEYQCTQKINDAKNKLRTQFQNCITENQQLKQKVQQLSQQNTYLQNKFERAQKYGLQVEKIGTEVKSKIEEESKQEIQRLIKKYEKQIKQMQETFYSDNLCKEIKNKQFIDTMEKQLDRLLKQNQKLAKEFKQLKKSSKEKQIQLEEDLIIKKRVIQEQNARIQVLRKSTVQGQVNIKSRIRKNRLENLEEELYWKRQQKKEGQSTMYGIKKYEENQEKRGYSRNSTMQRIPFKPYFDEIPLQYSEKNDKKGQKYYINYPLQSFQNNNMSNSNAIKKYSTLSQYKKDLQAQIQMQKKIKHEKSLSKQDRKKDRGNKNRKSSSSLSKNGENKSPSPKHKKMNKKTKQKSEQRPNKNQVQFLAKENERKQLKIKTQSPATSLAIQNSLDSPASPQFGSTCNNSRINHILRNLNQNSEGDYTEN